MIIRLNPAVTASQKETLFSQLRALAAAYHPHADERTIILPKYNDPSAFAGMDFLEAIQVDTPYQLASKAWKKETSFEVRGVEIGSATFNVMAGPCSVENEEQVEATASFLASCGVKFIRGGAYKPRTSPYSFRGRGLEGLKMLHAAAVRHDLRVVTEIMDLSLLDTVYKYADVLQVGSRNMQNFYLLDELGKTDKPVLLKRGMHARVAEWLSAAEYILSQGNEKVILCERGIRSFDSSTRNVMDIGVIPLIKELSHLPIIADPSHGTGASSRVPAIALAATAAGADGLLIEIHPDPAKALSDGQQTIDFNTFKTLLASITSMSETLPYYKKGTHLSRPVLKLESFS